MGATIITGSFSSGDCGQTIENLRMASVRLMRIISTAVQSIRLVIGMTLEMWMTSICPPMRFGTSSMRSGCGLDMETVLFLGAIKWAMTCVDLTLSVLMDI